MEEQPISREQDIIWKRCRGV